MTRMYSHAYIYSLTKQFSMRASQGHLVLPFNPYDKPSTPGAKIGQVDQKIKVVLKRLVFMQAPYAHSYSSVKDLKFEEDSINSFVQIN